MKAICPKYKINERQNKNKLNDTKIWIKIIMLKSEINKIN